VHSPIHAAKGFVRLTGPVSNHAYFNLYASARLIDIRG
jgi:hypothetical protein